MLQILILSLLIPQVYLFQQNDYRILHENITLEYYNTSYVKNAKFVLFNQNKTQKRVNATFSCVQDFFGNDITNVIDAYKISNDEYHAFPTLWKGNACDALKYDTFGTAVANYDTNFTDCPVKKGHYYLTNAYLDDSKLPPYAPKGRYMAECKVYYNKTILISVLKWYGEIQAIN